MNFHDCEPPKEPVAGNSRFMGVGCGDDIGQRDRRGPGAKSETAFFAVMGVFLPNVTRRFEPSVCNRPNRLFKRKSFYQQPRRPPKRGSARVQIKWRLPSITAATLPLRRLFTRLSVEPAKTPVNSSQYRATAGCW
jgi:hypothetical protein